jgi:hypothetical protein
VRKGRGVEVLEVVVEAGEEMEKSGVPRRGWTGMPGGVKVEKGAERLARFDSMGETTALLPCDDTLALNSTVIIKHQNVHS